MLKSFKNVRRLLVQRLPIEPAQVLRLNPQQDIFSHRKVWAERELLMNVGDAVASCIQRIGRTIRRALKRDRPGIRTDRCRENIHQRAFPGAIFPDDGANFSATHRKIHAIERERGPKAFLDARNFEQRRFRCFHHWRYLLSGGCSSCWASALSRLSGVTSITPVSMRFSTGLP